MLIYEQTLPDMLEVGKSIRFLYLLKEALHYAIDKGKFDLNITKLQNALKLDFILSQELMEYEEWLEGCKEYLSETEKETNDGKDIYRR